MSHTDVLSGASKQVIRGGFLDTCPDFAGVTGLIDLGDQAAAFAIWLHGCPLFIEQVASLRLSTRLVKVAGWRAAQMLLGHSLVTLIYRAEHWLRFLVRGEGCGTVLNRKVIIQHAYVLSDVLIWAQVLSRSLWAHFASLFLIIEPLHVHFDASLHTWLLNVWKWNETLGISSLARWVPNVLSQANLLICMDVLLVVLHATYLLELVFVILTHLKLVKCLTEDALLWDFKRLARIAREARSAHDVGAGGSCSLKVAEAITVIVSIHNLWRDSRSHVILAALGQFRVQTSTDTRACCLASGHNGRTTINSVKFVAQGLPVDLSRVYGYKIEWDNS